MSFEQEDRKKVTRGVIVTVLGRIASIAEGGFLFVARYIIGGVPFGLFYIAQSLVTLASQFFLSGFGDTVTYFASRERVKDEDRLYSALATCFAWSIGIATALALAINVLAWEIYRTWLADKHDSQVVELVQVLAWALPAMAVVQISVDAVKAHLDMKWAVLVNQVVRPAAFIILAVALAVTGMGAMAIALGYVCSYLLCVPIALYGYSRYFGVGATLRALPRALERWDILHFAFPQSINMLFTTGLTRIDVLVLSGFVGSNTVGIYGLVAEWVRPVHEVRRAFVGVFAPLVARYRALENREGISESLNLIVRWTACLGVPILIVLLTFYPEAVLQDIGGDWPLSRWVPWLLVAGPILSAFVGLSGNLLLMTGHARLLLLNSSFAVVLSVGLNLLLVPQYGPVGAAIATAVSACSISLLQVFEMQRFEGIRYRLEPFVKPSVALLLGAPVVAWLTSAGGHAWVYASGASTGLGVKIGVLLAVLALYAAVIFGWPGRNLERDWMVEKLRAWTKRRSAVT